MLFLSGMLIVFDKMLHCNVSAEYYLMVFMWILVWILVLVCC